MAKLNKMVAKAIGEKQELVRVPVKDEKPVFVEVIPLGELKGMLNNFIEDFSYEFAKAKAPKKKRAAQGALKFYASILHHLNKTEEVSNG